MMIDSDVKGNDDINVGDVIECWPEEAATLKRVAVVSAVSRYEDDTYFEAWIMATKPSGEFYTLSQGTFKFADHKFVRLERTIEPFPTPKEAATVAERAVDAVERRAGIDMAGVGEREP
jgi:hypothetical protein